MGDRLYAQAISVDKQECGSGILVSCVCVGGVRINSHPQILKDNTYNSTVIIYVTHQRISVSPRKMELKNKAVLGAKRFFFLILDKWVFKMSKCVWEKVCVWGGGNKFFLYQNWWIFEFHLSWILWRTLMLKSLSWHTVTVLVPGCDLGHSLQQLHFMSSAMVIPNATL